MLGSARLVASVLLGLAVLGEATPCRAQANYRTAPIGGRSQLLGGTGMTYGVDASAGFLNPATAVLVDDTLLSFSVNFYFLSIVTAPHWYTPGPIDTQRFGHLQFDSPSTTNIFFDSLPSSLCLFFRAGDIPPLAQREKHPRLRAARIGFCAATIETENYSGTADAHGEIHAPTVTRQVQSVTQRFVRFAAGPTYAMNVSNVLSIGASLHGNLATHRSLMTADATTYAGTSEPINSSFYRASRGDSFDLTATVGATLRFGKQTVGLSLRSPSVHVYGVGAVNETTSYTGGPNDLLSANGTFTARSPFRVGLGTGFQGNWGQAAIDVFYIHQIGQAFSAELHGHQAVTNGASVVDQPLAYDVSERAKGVVDFAAGVELYASPHLSVLTGVSTDISAVPQGTLDSSPMDYLPTRANRLAGSLGLASHGSGGELIFGTELSLGWGERLAVNSYQLPPELSPVGQGNYQMLFVIAGSTSLRTIQRAVEDVREVVDPKHPKPHPDPPASAPDLRLPDQKPPTPVIKP